MKDHCLRDSATDPAATEMLGEGVLRLLGPSSSRLIQLGELRVQEGDRVEVGFRELVGLQSERAGPLQIGRDHIGRLGPNQVAVLWPGQTLPLALAPLLIYRECELAEDVLYLNRDRDGKQLEYLSYSTGRPERDKSMAPALANLLSRVATGEEDYSIRIWDAENGKRLVSGSKDEEAIVWDLDSGKELCRIKEHKGAVQACFLAAGTRVATGSDDGTTRIWDVPSGAELSRLGKSEECVMALAVSPNERQLAWARGDEAVVWDLAEGRQQFVLKGHQGPIHSLHFSPCGRRLATAGSDGVIWLWDTTTGQQVLSLQGHQGQVVSVVFHPDGSTLFSVGDDGTLRAWETLGWKSPATSQD